MLVVLFFGGGGGGREVFFRLFINLKIRSTSKVHNSHRRLFYGAGGDGQLIILALVSKLVCFIFYSFFFLAKDRRNKIRERLDHK